MLFTLFDINFYKNPFDRSCVLWWLRTEKQKLKGF